MSWFRGGSSAPAAGLEAQEMPERSAQKQPKAPKDAGWNLEAGTSIAEGRWVFHHLGGGSRYEVYLVWDERLFALMVAKILRPDQVTDSRALRDLQREADVLKQLAHPVLLRGFGAAVDGPYPHLLLEHLEGPTLSRLIKRSGTLPLEQLLPLALHVAAVLHYLSAERIVHLDVKPSNIVMGIPPRLIDLSIARSIDSAARVRSSIGTDLYMPPEQCDPESYAGCIGPAADVWGLGATLYHAAAGKLPFPRRSGAGESADLTVRFPQLVDEPAPLPKGIPTQLADLILWMLAKNPAERPEAAEVASALEPLVAALPTRLAVTRRGLRAVMPPQQPHETPAGVGARR